MAWEMGYDLVGELPHRDRLRCATCRRWTRTYVAQGEEQGPDPDATSRLLCPKCATTHRGAA